MVIANRKSAGDIFQYLKEIFEELKTILAEFTEIPETEIKSDHTIYEDLKISVNRLQKLRNRIQKHFKVKIPHEDWHRLTQTNSVVWKIAIYIGHQHNFEDPQKSPQEQPA